ncbi:Error-prone repair protein ImuA [Mucilaginibacter sp. CSA2-8R]|uniref:ImuA family protein n=1 Tax=Mucilaginibacter sp. CSA2-8R TaxID=3141542 RepID=UPI00315CDA3A
MPVTDKSGMIEKLRQDILRWEGYRAPSAGTSQTVGLGPVEAAFPNGIFPLGTVHEMLCSNTEQAAACGGFVAGLLSGLMQQGGACLWIGLSGNVFPVSLKTFGVEPERIIFVHLMQNKDALWVMEEALKCNGLSAVVAELKEIDFKQSRRLQLAVEQSRVTGFILRNELKKMSTTACAARWRIKSIPSESVDGLPGIGFPRWQVELLRVRNGQPGNWVMEWTKGRFATVAPEILTPKIQMAG